MGTILEVTVSAEDFPLGRAFSELSDVTVEFDCVIPVCSSGFSYFWVWGEDAEQVRCTLQGKPVFDTLVLVDDIDGEGLFKAAWNGDVSGVMSAVANVDDLVLLAGQGTPSDWWFTLRSDNAHALSEFRQLVREDGSALTFERVRAVSERGGGGPYGLTPAQHEALVLAFEEGYYNHPREVTLEELGEQLGIAQTSVAARLRRGYRNLIGNTLTVQRS